MTEQFINEKDFHDKRYANEIARSGTSFYGGLKNLYEDVEFIINKHSQIDQRILEVGCGLGSNLPKEMHAAKYLGIDSSDVAISHCTLNYSDPKKEFIVADFLKVLENDSRFGFIYGIGVLHHLDYCHAFKLMHAANPKQSFMFVEPLIHNPVLKIFRALTPNARSADERPLSVDDLENITNYFPNVNLVYYGLLSPLSGIFKFNSFRDFLIRFDMMLSRIKFLRKFFWCVRIENNV